MPELPDITIYVEALERRLVDDTVQGLRLVSPFLLRTVDPPADAVRGRCVLGVRRLGKRIVLDLQGGLHLVVHLMIAGRLRWDESPGAGVPGRIGLGAIDMSGGTLLITEASSKKRAAMHLVQGETALRALDPGGLDVFVDDAEKVVAALARTNHTLKRALTDPRILSGIGNAYSDEILHAARLSPFQRTQSIGADALHCLYQTARERLRHWTDVLRISFGDRFPKPGEITAFRPEFAVHGKYGQPCPDCGTPVQRVRYVSNEMNYCPRCQTGGRIYADRSLSRLLKNDWPRTVEELELGAGA